MGDAADDLTMRWASTGEDTGFAPRARLQSTTANLGQVTQDGFAQAWDEQAERIVELKTQLANALGERDAAHIQLEERQQMCRALSNALNASMRTIEKAHRLVTQWLARPEPPNTGELIELATILEGSKQPEDGREIK